MLLEKFKKPESEYLKKTDILLKMLEIQDFPINLNNKTINKNGWTDLHDAIAKQNIDEVKRLLPKMNNSGTDQGWSVAHVAAQVGNIDIAKLVFPKSDMAGNVCGVNPFHISSLCGKLEVMAEASKSIEAKGGDPGAGNVDAYHALHFAAFGGQIESVKYLCEEHSALINRGDNYGFNAAHIAAAKGKIDILNIIFRHHNSSIHPSCGNKEGIRIGHIAAHYGHRELLDFWYDSKSWDKNAENTKPIHIAVMSDKNGDHLSEIKYLIEDRSQSENEADNNGATPLNLALYGKHKEILAYFLERNSTLKEEIIGSSFVPEEYKNFVIEIAGEVT